MKVVEKLRCRIHSCHEETIAGARARHVQKVAFRVVHLLKVRLMDLDRWVSVAPTPFGDHSIESPQALAPRLRARSTTLSSDVDMNSSVNASAMFPQLRLTPARAAFARPGPHATAFPDVNALLQPSDSLVPVGRRSGRPSPAAYLGAEACSSPPHRSLR